MANNDETPRKNEKPNVNENPGTNETNKEKDGQEKIIMQDKNVELIERDYGTEAHINSNQALVKKSQCDSTEDFHKILVLNNHGSSAHHNIMFLDSMSNFEGLDTNRLSCLSFQESNSCNESNTCTNFSDDSNENVSSKSNCSSIESYSSRVIEEVCALKQCFQNIIAENQDLRFKLNNAIEQNDSMEAALKSVAPFRLSSDGTIKFPGKKEMEKKIVFAETEIAKLKVEIMDLRSIKRKLKTFKQFTKQNDPNDATMSSDYPCRNSSFKNDTCDTNIKVKCLQIKQIESQIKQKKEELKHIKSDYDSSVKRNHRNSAKSKNLALSLVDLKKKLQGHQLDVEDDVVNNLNKIKENIETNELIIKERTNQISDCDQKTKAIQLETKSIIKKTDDLKTALENLFNHFNDAYKELESVYQEQSEEIVMLPTVLQVTHIKLQEETDLRVVAEETKNKLERAVKNAEETKKLKQNEQSDEENSLLIADLETENKKLELTLNLINEKIELDSASLSKETEEQETKNKEIQDTITECIRNVKAFDNFSSIHIDKIVKDVEGIQILLMKLQGKECAKAMIKRKVMSHLRGKIDSIYQNVEECKSQLYKFDTDCLKLTT